MRTPGGGWPQFAVTAAAICLVLPWLSSDYGMTWDEQARFAHGTRVLSFYRGDLDASDFPEDGLHLYGGLFDVAANSVHALLGEDLWITRHRVNAVVGALGIVATGLLAARLLSQAAGLTAMVLLVLSPRYLGHAMNNPKDVPFAAFCMVALVAFVLARAEPPFLSWPRALVVGLALALPLNVRPGALLYFLYFCVFVLALVARSRAWSGRRLVPVAGRVIVVGIVMLVAGCVFWPWALQNPFVRPFEALLGVADFSWQGTVLFNGEDVSSNDLPWSYVPTWMAITTPPVVLAGTALSLIPALADVRRRRMWLIGLWGVAALPVLLAILGGSTLYDGWRHLLFVYPPLIVLAAAGWRFLVNERRPRGVRVAGVALLVAGCLEPLVFMVRNHPNEVVYFNALVGGPRGAAARFELDYWGNSLLQATEWTAALATRSGSPLCVSGQPYSIVRGDAQRFDSLYSEWPYRNAHHIELVLARAPRRELARLAARPDILHVIQTADGAPLAYIVAGPRIDAVRDRILQARVRGGTPGS